MPENSENIGNTDEPGTLCRVHLLFLILLGLSKEIFLVNLSLIFSVIINVLNLFESIKLKNISMENK